MSNRLDPVQAQIELRLVVPAGPSLPVVADLRYEPSDPYAVHVAFHTGGNDSVQWTFARSLLTEGVTHSVGEGDVRVWPAQTEHRSIVSLSLSSPSGRALFEVPLAELIDFLTGTYAAVPTDGESDFVDVDAELALLLWSEPEI